MDYVTNAVAIEALSRIDGTPFEKFVNEFTAGIMGAEYVPLGGIHDGGADGVLEGPEGSYIQTSIRKDYLAKIRHTVVRLKETGRDPKRLTYVSSIAIKDLDRTEQKLTTELQITIRIRDQRYIASHINDSPATIASFKNHLQPLILDLTSVANGALVPRSIHVTDPSVFVFLSQESNSDGSQQNLLNAVIESLIFWALEGTDPDRRIFMSEEEIKLKILATLPSIENLIRRKLSRGLERLSLKANGHQRRIRYYRKTQLYCLPFETRESLSSDITSDSDLRNSVLLAFQNRVRQAMSDRCNLSEDDQDRCSRVCLRAIQFCFEKQGISLMSELGASLSNDGVTSENSLEKPETSDVFLSDHLKQAIDEENITGTLSYQFYELGITALRGMLFTSTKEERQYLRKLSKTYTLLFSLSLEPRLINYFEQMTGHFYLYIGSDQLIRALSETYLNQPDRIVTNTLKIARKTGARLILTEPVLHEVVHHLRTSDYEYKNTFESLNDDVPYEIARNSPKILVRAYMYSRIGLSPYKAKNWPSFINEYCDYPELHRSESFDSIRRYLQAEYGFEYRSRAQLFDLVEESEYNSLKQRLSSRNNKHNILDENDALMTLAVYGHRRRSGETSTISEFGYGTWWLTEESRILQYTEQLVSTHNNARYIMRPEFLLNYLTLAPSAFEARETFKEVFPSLLGVSLSRRLPDTSIKNLLETITSVEELSDARKVAKLAQLADKLKGDFTRLYLTTQDSEEDTTGVDAIHRQAIFDQ